MHDPVFVGRIKVACLNFAAYIYNEAPATPGHTSRLRWSSNTMAGPEGAANAVAPMVTMDPNVQAQGADISDPDLQTAVENAVNKII